MRSRPATALLVLALAGAYFGLVSLEQLPYAHIPTWWRELWPSSHASAITWFEVQDIVGALAAAAPLALAIAWIPDLARPKFAFAIAAPIAVYTLLGLQEYWPVSKSHGDLLLIAGVSAAARLLSVPVVVLIAAATLARLRLTKLGAGRDG